MPQTSLKPEGWTCHAFPDKDNGWHFLTVIAVQLSVMFPARAYTRPLLSSTQAVSDTQNHPTHPKHPLTPPEHGLHNPYALPLSHKKRSS